MSRFRTFPKSRRTPAAGKWFWAALVLLSIFLVYTAILSTGAFLIPTIQQEQWLLHRPLTGIDCVFDTWATADTGPPGLLLLLALAVVCLRLGYRRRVLFYLVVLFVLSVGIELAGKQLILQPLPRRVEIGLTALDCPQINNQSTFTKVLMFVGIWWVAPQATQQSILEAQRGSTPSFSSNTEPPVPTDNSYPSGHAMRWSFLGAIACWLVWRHLRRPDLRLLRPMLMVLALLIAIGGGLSEFYIGNHFLTDITGGYLIGIGFSCFAIGLLIRNVIPPRERLAEAASSNAALS